MSGTVNVDPTTLRVFEVEVVRGKVPGYTVANAIGLAPDIDQANVPMSVWAGPAKGLYPWPSAPVALELVSSSANDAAAGTGARTVIIELLNANYERSFVTVTLNGITPVVLDGLWLRINNMTTLTVGSLHANAGNLTLRVSGGGTTLSYMLAGKGRAQQAAFTIPRGFTAYGTLARINVLRGGTNAQHGTVELRARTFPNGFIVRNTVQVGTHSDPEDSISPYFPVSFPETTDLDFIVTDASADNTVIQSVFQCLLVSTTVGN